MSIEHEEKVVRRKKRISKKTKKGWRKGSDIKDVETFLDQARRDDRTGVHDKKKKGIFFDYNSKELPDKNCRATRLKELRCHRGLLNDSCVPPLHISQKVFKLKEKSVKKSGPKQSRKRSSGPLGFYDLWGSEAKTSEDVEEHFAKVCKKRRVKLPSHHSVKPSAIRSLEVPLPGASYNPAPNDHQVLLQKAVEVEEKKEKEERKLKRALDDFFPDETEKSSEVTWLKEMAAGLFDDDDHADKDQKEGAKDEDDQVKSSFRATQNRKKTKRQKKLEKARLLAEKARKKEKDDRIRGNQKFRLKTIKKEIKEQEFKLATKAAWRELENEERKSQPKKLGKLSYEEPTIAVKLSDELIDSLRALKPEGHVADIMFKRLQKKNVIEPRKRAKPIRRTKSKLFEKKDHKAVTL